MIVGDLLEQLSETGKPVFESRDLPRDFGKPAEKTRQILEELDRVSRSAAPHETAPQLDIKLAHRSAGALLRLSQFFVFREIDKYQLATETDELLSSLEFTPDPSRIWSIDLTLQHLPSLHRLVMTADDQDPLIQVIRELAMRWPLSGIGITELDWAKVDWTPILQDNSLRGLLVDRVLESQNPDLASMPEIEPLVRQALGDHQNILAPWLADKW